MRILAAIYLLAFTAAFLYGGYLLIGLRGIFVVVVATVLCCLAAWHGVSPW